MKTLLIDLGNSRLKWALADDSGVVLGEPVAHSASGFGDLLPLWEAAAGSQRALLASTALTLTDALCRDIGARLNIDTEVFQSPKQAIGIRSAYDQPQTLGSDRFLAMAAARRHCDGAFLLCDAGTALTLDLVDEDGQHLGGLIVPSPLLMRESLHRGTAGVRTGDSARLREFARNTDDAVWSGVCMASIALIEHSHRKALLGVGDHVDLLLSGGSMPLLVQHLDIPHRTLPNLVLEGLRLWSRETLPGN